MPTARLDDRPARAGSRLLVDDAPMLVLPRLAALLGLEQALLLQQIHYWLCTCGHPHDGRLWIYNSCPEWAAQCPWWSDETIRRHLRALRRAGLLLTANYNRCAADRTRWYSIDYDALEALLPDAPINRPALPAPPPAAAPVPAAPPVRPPAAEPAAATVAAAAGPVHAAAPVPPAPAPRPTGASWSGAAVAPSGESVAPSGDFVVPSGESVVPSGDFVVPSGDFVAPIPETTAETRPETIVEISAETSQRARAGGPGCCPACGSASPGCGPPPLPLPGVESFTTTDADAAWWAAELARAGLPPAAVDAATETALWQDAIRAGRRSPPRDAAADWRTWMRRAIRYALTHPLIPAQEARHGNDRPVVALGDRGAQPPAAAGPRPGTLAFAEQFAAELGRGLAALGRGPSGAAALP